MHKASHLPFAPFWTQSGKCTIEHILVPNHPERLKVGDHAQLCKSRYISWVYHLQVSDMVSPLSWGNGHFSVLKRFVKSIEGIGNSLVTHSVTMYLKSLSIKCFHHGLKVIPWEIAHTCTLLPCIEWLSVLTLE